MTVFIEWPAGHHSDIGHFLPGTVWSRYANYANLNYAMEFQIVVECRVFGRNTPNLDTVFNISQSWI